MTSYQGMTRLERAQEEKLLRCSREQLLTLVNAPGKIAGHRVSGADTRYTLVQMVARLYTDAEVRALAESAASAPAPILPVPRAAAPSPAPKPKPKPKPSAPRIVPAGAVHLNPNGGQTQLQPGSIRARLVDQLKAVGGAATFAELEQFLGANPIPHLRKLADVGWVKW